MLGPARGKPQSIGETGKGPVTGLRVFANGGSVKRGENPGPAPVGKPCRGGGKVLSELRPEDGGTFRGGGGAVEWLAQRQR